MHAVNSHNGRINSCSEQLLVQTKKDKECKNGAALYNEHEVIKY